MNYSIDWDGPGERDRDWDDLDCKMWNANEPDGGLFADQCTWPVCECPKKMTEVEDER